VALPQAEQITLEGPAPVEPRLTAADRAANLAAAGTYVDLGELRDLETGRPADQPTLPDPRRGFSFAVPGLPAPQTQVNLGEEDAQVILEAAGITDLGVDALLQGGTKGIYQVVARVRNNLRNGVIGPAEWRDFITTLENLGLAVRPAPVRTPWSHRLQKAHPTGFLTVEQLVKNFENAQAEKAVLAHVLEDLNPRGYEDTQLKVDMAKFWKAWAEYVPSLELIIMDEAGTPREPQGGATKWGLMEEGPHGLIRGTIKPGAQDPLDFPEGGKEVVRGMKRQSQVFLWRNPKLEFNETGHFPGVQGHLGIVSVLYHPDGTPMIWEVQSDYHKNQGGFAEEIKEIWGAVALVEAALAEAEVRLQGHDTQIAGITDTDALEPVLQQREKVLKDMEKLRRKAQSLKEEIEAKTRSFEHGNYISKGEVLNPWLIEETFRALRLQGHEKVYVAGPALVAQREMFGGLEQYHLHSYATGVPKLQAEIRELRKARRAGTAPADVEEQIELKTGVIKTHLSEFISNVQKYANNKLLERDEATRILRSRSGINPDIRARAKEVDRQYRERIEKKAVDAWNAFLEDNGKTIGKLAELYDIRQEARAVLNVMRTLPSLIRAGRDETKLAHEVGTIHGYKEKMGVYKRHYEFIQKNFTAKEAKFHPKWRSEFKMLEVTLPEKYDDPAEPIIVFRDQIQPTTGLPARADAVINEANRQVDDTLGDHC